MVYVRQEQIRKAYKAKTTFVWVMQYAFQNWAIVWWCVFQQKYKELIKRLISQKSRIYPLVWP